MGAQTVAQSEYEASLEFLSKNAPPEDRTLGEQYMHENIELALAARQAHEWAAAVPLDIFLNYVLPYANVDEPRERWRPMFRDVLQPLVQQAKSVSEAALILNRDMWRLWGIHFKSDQTPEIMSPSQVISAGYASCTGLSIFLVNACRAVGIPARVAGIPSWNIPDQSPERFNNHNWVEIWDNGIWSFTGAAEYTPEGFNHTWFFPGRTAPSIPGNLLHAIYAASFAPPANATTYFPLAWNPSYQGVHAYDVTQYYLDAAKPSPS